MEDTRQRAPIRLGRRPWEPPHLKAIGTIAHLVQSGGGKVSAVVGDSGDPPFKPPGGA